MTRIIQNLFLFYKNETNLDNYKFWNWTIPEREGYAKKYPIS